MKMKKRIALFFVASAFMGALFASTVFAQDFSRNLGQGSSGPEVVRLQEVLKSIPDVYPNGIVTGYFGTQTRRAVQRFQMKYGIISEGDERTTGFGLVGRRSRMKLNELAKNSTPPSIPISVQPPPPLSPSFQYKRAEGNPDNVTDIRWGFDEREYRWKASGDAPACPYPLKMISPVDVSLVTAVLYPGQYRGSDYKTHGGFRFDTGDTAVVIKAPMDGYIWRGSRYLQTDEIQYLFFFISPCGVMYKFDHLLTLAPKLQVIAEKLPPAKPNESRTSEFAERVMVRAGEVIATEIGFRKGPNMSVDFGVYDLRVANQISKDPNWARLHADHREAEFYALCIFDVLPVEDSVRLKTLPSGNEGKSSDYCGSVTDEKKQQELPPRTIPPPVLSAPIFSPTSITPPAVPAQISAQPPVLKNFGVRFEEWNKMTGRAGSFLFLPTENKLFLEYGVTVMGPDGPKILPTFEYRVARDTDVLAAIDGVITKLTYQDQTKDYEIHIQPTAHSQWILEHDHISNPLISMGDTVKAGDILGKAGTLGGELGRTEIMLFTGGSVITTYCPFKYLDPALKDVYREKILRYIKDWEEFKNNPALYNEESHVFPGCVRETILDT